MLNEWPSETVSKQIKAYVSKHNIDTVRSSSISNCITVAHSFVLDNHLWPIWCLRTSQSYCSISWSKVGHQGLRERERLLNIIHKALRHRKPGYYPLQACIYSVATQIYWSPWFSLGSSRKMALAYVWESCFVCLVSRRLFRHTQGNATTCFTTCVVSMALCNILKIHVYKPACGSGPCKSLQL